MDENRSDYKRHKASLNGLRTALEHNDPAAVDLMWARYAKNLLAFLQAVLCSRHDAEDVLQTIFVKIVRQRHKLTRARCLDAYVYKIARNEAYNFVSKRKRDKNTKKIPETWLKVTESNQESSELAEQLQAALVQLPQQQREVIVLKIYRQKTFMEISRLLRISQNTVASRYRYGMEKLRNLMRNMIL